MFLDKTANKKSLYTSQFRSIIEFLAPWHFKCGNDLLSFYNKLYLLPFKVFFPVIVDGVIFFLQLIVSSMCKISRSRKQIPKLKSFQIVCGDKIHEKISM